MCQIIYKTGEAQLPFDKLRSTCEVNPDGFGIMALDRGKTVIRKHYNGKNDPDVLAKVLEEYKSLPYVGVHVRFRTKGPIGCDSCHPFEAYSGDGDRLMMMHNGTINGFGSNDTVDSQEYANTILGPLYARTKKAGIDPFDDDLFEKINEKYLGTGNKLLLMSNGGFKIINQGQGEWIKSDGSDIWVSNTYSFNRYHRESSVINYPYGHWNQPSKKVTGGVVRLSTDDKKKSVEVQELPKRTRIESYTEKHGVELDDLFHLTYENICDLVDYEPEEASRLIVELLRELQDLTYDDVSGDEDA